MAKIVLHGGACHGMLLECNMDILMYPKDGGNHEYVKTKYFLELYEGDGNEFTRDEKPELTRRTVYMLKAFSGTNSPKQT